MKSGAALVDARVWSPRAEIAPVASRTDNGEYLVRSNGSRGCYGGWDLRWRLPAAGGPVCFAVALRAEGVRDAADAVEVLIQWVDADGRIVDWRPAPARDSVDGLTVFRSDPLPAHADAEIAIRLLLRWSETGELRWRDPRFEPAAAAAPRPVRLGAASSPGTIDDTVDSNRRRFLDVAARAADAGVDILCLPEVIFTNELDRGAPDKLAPLAVAVDGPEIGSFRDVARARGIAIAFSVHERAGELVHNTGVVIDATGAIAGAYRKVHMAIAEAWMGVTPGDHFEVADLTPAGARVGMNICMDSSSLESSRQVAKLGAEVLLLPINGDWRATAWAKTPEENRQFSLERWLLIQRMRALDNHLWVVVARNRGEGTGIFAPDGSVLALDRGNNPLVTADVDLAERRPHPTGPPYKDVCWHQRRELAYRP